MLKLVPSQLSDNSSDVVPGMSRVAITPPKTQTNKSSPLIEKKQLSLSVEKDNSNLIMPSILVGTLIGGGIAAFLAGKQPIIRHTPNTPAGLVGAGLGMSALLGYTGYQIAKYGGFFDKQRDFYNMFKNL